MKLKKTICLLMAFFLIWNMTYASSKPTEEDQLKGFLVGFLVLGAGFFFVMSMFKAATDIEDLLAVDEFIDLTVREDQSVAVKNEFRFYLNPKSEKRYKFSYRFPAQWKYGRVDSLEIKINSMLLNDPSLIKIRNDKISFTLNFFGTNRCDLQINFVQKSGKNRYGHDLGSVKKLKKGTRNADVVVHIASVLKLDHCNYTLEQIETQKQGFTSYQFLETNLEPEEDFEIRWKN